MSSSVDADWSKVSPPFDVTLGHSVDRLGQQIPLHHHTG